MIPMKLLLKLDPHVVMYLVVINKELARRAEIIKVKPSEKFFDMVRDQVTAYLSEEAEPPKEIASAIMNIADDMLAGREITLRTGDYITLMSFAKAKKIL